MQKGISPVVATIMLLLITISLVGFAFLFFSRSVESSSKAGEEQLEQQISQTGIIFDIEYTDKNKIYIRNQGMVNISNLTFYVNNVAIDSITPAIPPGTVGIVTLNDSQLAMAGSSGPVEIRAASAGFSDKITADLYEKYTAAYWKFDEGSGTVINGLSGNNNPGVYYGESFNDGTITGATQVSGKYGSALRLDGIDDYVEVPNSASLNPTDAITIEAWIRQNQQGDELIMKFGTDWATNSYGYSLITSNDGSVSFWIGVGTYPFPMLSTGPNNFTLNNWHHLAATYDRNKMKIYVDGVLKAETPETRAIVPTSGTLFISTPWAQYYNGTIDEVRIYNRALTGEEIQEDMNSAYPISRTIGTWNFNEDSGTVANDTHIWVKGKYGAALSFDGIDDYVDAGNGTSLSPTNAITIEAWIKPDSSIMNDGAPHGIVARGEPWWSPFKGYELDVYSNRIRWSVGDGTTFAEGPFPAFTETTKFSHIVATFDTSDKYLRVYINGVAYSQLTTLTGIGITPAEHTIIGRIWAGDPYRFNGTIDEVRILNIARPMS